MKRRILVSLFALGLSISTFAQTSRFPSATETADRLRMQYWIQEKVQQIPATVIDKGIFKAVPYLSYKSGDYELNVYGDPESPSAVELGVYRSLLNNRMARKWCVAFISGVLSNQTRVQQESWDQLDLDKDIGTNGEMIVEITPPTDEDAYGGWWVSVYSVRALDAVRATPKELAEITVPVSALLVSDTNSVAGTTSDSAAEVSGWTPSDMQHARSTATLMEADRADLVVDGQHYRNARIVKSNPAEATIYHSAGVATIPLEQLSVDLQQKLAYDPNSAQAYRQAVAENERQLMEARRLAAQKAASVQAPPPPATPAPAESAPPVVYAAPAESAPPSEYVPYTEYYGGYVGGRVYNKDFNRRNGAYVQPLPARARRR